MVFFRYLFAVSNVIEMYIFALLFSIPNYPDSDLTNLHSQSDNTIKEDIQLSTVVAISLFRCIEHSVHKQLKGDISAQMPPTKECGKFYEGF